MLLETGKVLNNRYRIVKLLGQGGFGAVYRAWDMNLSGPCAIKENFETSPAAQSQFAREASILYNLRHPNLPKVIDHFGIPGQGQYLVMEFIEGQDLQDKIDQASGPLPEAKVLPWIWQVCDALNYLHHRTPPIIHRDIKPANVRITPEGTVYLVDFGIAKLFDPERKTTLGARAVTPGYSPFEQYGQKPTDVRTDVYALGATLYTTLTSRLPIESIERIAGATLPPPRTLNPDVSTQVEAAIFRAMAIMPEDRFQSIEEFKNTLIIPVNDRESVGRSTGVSVVPTQEIVATSFQTQPITPSVDLSTREFHKPVKSAHLASPGKEGKRKSWLAPVTIGAVLLVVMVAGLAVYVGYKNLWPGSALPENPAMVVPTNTTLPITNPAPVLTSVPLPSTFECSDRLGCVTVAPGAPISIGYLLVVEGPNASLGIDARNGIEIAMNDQVQVLGHEIQLIGYDDGCNSETGQTAAAALSSNPDVVAVMGTSCSAAARTAVPLLSGAGFTIVSPSSTSPDLTEPGNPNHYPGFLRTAINDSFQGASAARFAREQLGSKKTATIQDGSQYASNLQALFAEEFKKLGGEITAQEMVDSGQTDMNPLLQRIASGKPDLIYFPIFVSEGSQIIRQARQNNDLSQTRLMGADGLFMPELIESAGDALEGFLVSSPFVSGTGYDIFLAKYRNRFGKEPMSAFHAHAYDAARMIFAAIEKVAVQTADGALHVPRESLRNALYATKDFSGITGILTCNPNGDCANPSIGVYQYQIGKYPPDRIWP